MMRRTMILGMFIGVSVVFAAYMRQRDNPELRRACTLEVDERELRIDDVVVTGQWSHRFRVSNPSAVEIRVSDVIPSCHCAELEPRAFLIGPGDYRDIVVSTDLMAASHGEAEWPFAFDFAMLHDRVGEEVLKIHIEGHARAPIVFLPDHVSCGVWSSDELGEVRRVISVERIAKIRSINVSVEQGDPPISILPEPNTIDEYTVSVDLRRSKSAGYFERQLRFQCTCEPTGETVVVPLTVSGFIKKQS